MSEDMQKLMTEPTVDMALTARVLNTSLNAAYRAREIGDIPSFKVGGQWRVPTAPLRRMLGLSEARSESAVA